MGDGMELEDEYFLAVEAGLPPGWRLKSRGRKGNYYYDPEGKRYVNLTELQERLGGALPDELRLKKSKRPETAVPDEPATEFGLPEGWTVRRYTSKNVFFSPEGEKFTSLKVALELTGAPSPSVTSSKKSRLNSNGEDKAAKEGKPQQEVEAEHRQVEASATRRQEEAEVEEEAHPAAAAAAAAAAARAGGAAEPKEAPSPQTSSRKRGGVPSQFPEEPATELGLPDGWTVRKYFRKNVYFSPAGERFTSLVTASKTAAAASSTATPPATTAATPPRSKRRSAAGHAESSAAADHSPQPSAGPGGGAGGKRRQAVAAAQRRSRRTAQGGGSAAAAEREERLSAERGLALELGLPAGWRVRRRRTSTSFYCWDPDGKKFSKPNEVAAALGGSLPEQLQSRWLRSDDSDAAAAVKKTGGSSKKRRQLQEAGGGGGSRSASSSSSSSSSASDAEPSAELKRSEHQPPKAPSAAAEGGGSSISLQLEPTELRFPRGAHSQTRTVRLTSSGTHGGYVAFKVKTNITTPHNAEPTLGALAVGGGRDVHITLHPRGGDDPNRDKHAFLFQAVACESRDGVPKELWGKMDPKTITDVKLPIHWVDEPPASKEAAPAAPGVVEGATVGADARGGGSSAASPPAEAGAEAPPAEQQQPQEPDPALPASWEMHWSDDHEMYYYWNPDTEESRWTRPTL